MHRSRGWMSFTRKNLFLFKLHVIGKYKADDTESCRNCCPSFYVLSFHISDVWFFKIDLFLCPLHFTDIVCHVITQSLSFRPRKRDGEYKTVLYIIWHHLISQGQIWFAWTLILTDSVITSWLGWLDAEFTFQKALRTQKHTKGFYGQEFCNKHPEPVRPGSTAVF